MVLAVFLSYHICSDTHCQVLAHIYFIEKITPVIPEKDFYLKKRVFYGGAVLCLLGLAFLLYYLRPEARFLRLLDEKLYTELSGNTLDLHYTLAHPEEYGIYYETAVLPAYQQGSELSATNSLSELSRKLEAISSRHMHQDNKKLYDLLSRRTALDLSMANFPYYGEPLSPASGMQSQLPILLAEYTFRCARDVEDYLQILEQTGDYFDGLALYQQEKSAAGLFMSDAAAEAVIEQCGSILDKNSLETGTHFLQETFRERLAALPAEEADEHTRQLWCSQNDRLLSTVMLPAYDRLADTLCLLLGTGTNDAGLCAYPDGKDYYALLVQRTTGSDRSLSQLYTMIKDQWETDAALLQKQLSSAKLQAALKDQTVLSFPDMTADTILSDLKQHMYRDFPDFPRADPAPEVTVKTVCSSLEDFTAPAFYLTPPLDDVSQNVIYINHSSTQTGLELYTTLAHEGYPGHLYQAVYENLSRQLDRTHPVGALLFYGGYTEGWAFYVEMLAYQYAAALQQKQATDTAADYITCLQLSREMQLGLFSLLDIGIHYYGMTYADVEKALTAYGITDRAAIHQIYRYLVEEPATYLKYYVGYLEILSLQKEAMELWGDAYSQYRFHDFLLKEGPADFTYLHQALQAD